MKKKSIFVVALAALMLIAFTACEQAVPTFGGKELVRLGVLEGVNVVYVGGEKGSTAASVSNGDKFQVSLPVSAPNYR